MTLRYLTCTMAGVLFTCGVVTVAPAYAQLRDGNLLPPQESGLVTAVGCFLRGGDDGKKYVLGHPRKGPINSVAEERCTAAAGDNFLEIKDANSRGMNDQLLGRWIEINGRLERETSTDPNNLREIEVRSFRVVPVIPPQRVAAPPAPVAAPPLAPAPEPAVREPEPAPVAAAPAPEPAPVATAGQGELPKTAGYAPAGGLIGLLALGGAFALRSFRTRADI